MWKQRNLLIFVGLGCFLNFLDLDTLFGRLTIIVSGNIKIQTQSLWKHFQCHHPRPAIALLLWSHVLGAFSDLHTN